MSYVNYDDDIVKNAGVKLAGWPSDIPFQKPASIGAVTDLRAIWGAIERKELHFGRVSAEDRRKAFRLPMDEVNGPDQQQSKKKRRRERSDKGKSRGPRKKSATTTENDDCVENDIADSGRLGKRKRTGVGSGSAKRRKE